MERPQNKASRRLTCRYNEKEALAMAGISRLRLLTHRPMGMARIIAYLCGVLCVASPLAFGAPVKVKDVRVAVEPSKTRVVLDLSEAIDYRTFSLENPNRLVVDLQNVRGGPDATNMDFTGSAVRKLRFGAHESDLRMVIDLNGAVQPHSFLLPPVADSGPRLVIDLFAPGHAPSPETTTLAAMPAHLREAIAPVVESVAAASGPGLVPKIAAPEPAPVESALLEAHSDVDADSDAAPQEEPLEAVITAHSAFGTGRDVVIAIDAGHGGKDPGAVGRGGTREKDVVLAIARKVAALINKEAGLRAIMIREGDEFIPLRQRMINARKQKADLFISIHADASDDRRARGSSVYVLSQRGATSEAARWLAARENAADLIGGVRLDDKDDLLASVLLDLSQTATSEASQHLASNLLQSLTHAGRMRSRKIERAGFMVLKSPDIPSVLVETAYLSNATEEQLLRSYQTQQEIAQAVLGGLRDYLADYAPPGTAIAEYYRSRQVLSAAQN
jgi:N-acetylmuramoyl-L-alanine amidase